MKITTTQYRIDAGLDSPVSLAFVSDLHGVKNKPVLDIIDELSPDAVLVGGDFIHDEICYQDGIDFLKSASEKYPTLVALGNHETTLCDIREILSDMPLTLLDNEAVCFKGLRIGGLTSGLWYSDRIPQLKWLEGFEKSDGYKILLCHHPEYFTRYIRDKRIDLTLSGHAHGGQWRIFDRGIYAPGQGLFPRYTSGMYENRLIVGRGIGNKAPLPRINNQPEIILLKIY